jgi:protease PrsW
MPRAAQAVPQVSTAGSTVRRPPTGPSWVQIFVVGLVLWLATVLVTFATENSNLIPTIILLGSFLTPITFVAYALGRADEVLTAQRIFSAFVCGGLLGVLGASVLESAFLRQPSGLVYLGVGLIEEGVKLAALWLLARRLPRYTMRNGMVLGAAVGFGFAAFESAGYAFNALFTTTGLSLWNLLETEVLRGILMPVGHGLWTAILGGALFATVARSGRPQLTGAVLGWYALVALLHALWDASRGIAVWLTLQRSQSELADLLEEQAALRRVATLVAEGTPPEKVFPAVNEEVARLLDVDGTRLTRYEADVTATIVASWGGADDRPGGHEDRAGWAQHRISGAQQRHAGAHRGLRRRSRVCRRDRP